MKRIFTLIVFLIPFSTMLFAEANYVYHTQSTTTSPTSCNSTKFISNLHPNSTQSVIISYKVEYASYWNQARIYYTTDGTTPSATKGTASGTTQVITASWQCTESGTNAETLAGTIPAQAYNTTVKYIVSAWHSGGGDEIFANGPGAPCSCGSPTNSSALATVYSYTVDTPLGFDLLEFNAEKKQGNIFLKWVTANDKDNDSFEIQKSNNNQNWRSIGKTISLKSITGSFYTFEDNLVGGVSYYRILAHSIDGKVDYSKIIAVNDGKQTLSVYPNPVKSELNLITDGNTEGGIIYDITGKTVRQVTDTHIKVDVQNLPNGVYFVRLTGKNGLLSEPVRFIKQ